MRVAVLTVTLPGCCLIVVAICARGALVRQRSGYLVIFCRPVQTVCAVLILSCAAPGLFVQASNKRAGTTTIEYDDGQIEKVDLDKVG
jgi:hypothetical protein